MGRIRLIMLSTPLAFMIYMIMRGVTLYIAPIHLKLTATDVSMLTAALWYVWYVIRPIEKRDDTYFLLNGYYLIPVEICIIASLAQYHPYFVLGLLVVLLLGAVVICIAMKKRYEDQGEDGIREEKKKSARQTAVLMWVCCVMGVPSVPALFLYDLRSPSYALSASEVPGEEAGIREGDMGFAKSLKKEVWEGLGREERLKVLLELLTYESGKLGIDCPDIRTKCLSKNVLGQYSEGCKEMRIDIKELDQCGSYEAVLIMLHELFHAYQHKCVAEIELTEDMKKLKYFESLTAWKENVEHYENGMKDAMQYLKQPLERDAQGFAEEEIKLYENYF